jgi:uncharacterized protein (UPF0371 family)
VAIFSLNSILIANKGNVMKINILLASVLILASYSAWSFLAISELKELQQNDFQTKFIRYDELNHKIRNLCIGMTRDPEKCEDFFSA